MTYERSKTDIHNLPEKRSFRKELRSSLTSAEAALWQILKGSKLDGRKFRRQHSVGKYILDFYCPSEKLAVELDGNSHFSDNARDYDLERRLYLVANGIKVIRFENKRVFDESDWVIDVICSNFGPNERTTPSAEAATQLPSLEKEGCPKGGVVRSLPGVESTSIEERTTPSAETAATPPL
ncbi:MAG: endonuclease domain-containing protein [Blastocatellia bacterium]|nr:endonuclease domain-containing protein [Blastocatellia bacterium]